MQCAGKSSEVISMRSQCRVLIERELAGVTLRIRNIFRY